MKIYTIGHSTRSIKEFLSLLQKYEIKILADVRAFSSSSKHPQFNRDALRKSLSQAGIEYHWLGTSLPPFARIQNSQLTYPGTDIELQ